MNGIPPVGAVRHVCVVVLAGPDAVTDLHERILVPVEAQTDQVGILVYEACPETPCCAAECHIHVALCLPVVQELTLDGRPDDVALVECALP